MSSKRAQRRRACDGKVGHTTASGAFTALRIAKSKGQFGMSIYRCVFCGRYHIGHTPGHVRQQRAARLWGSYV